MSGLGFYLGKRDKGLKIWRSPISPILIANLNIIFTKSGYFFLSFSAFLTVTVREVIVLCRPLLLQQTRAQHWGQPQAV